MCTWILHRQRRTACILVAAVGLGLLGMRASPAAEPTGAQQEAAQPGQQTPTPDSASKAEQSGERSFRGRLPAYYRYVVTDQQRQEIYRIQAEYAPRIEQLRAQLEALIAERDAKVQAVLKPEQLKRVEQLREEARKNRQARAKAEGSNSSASTQ